LFLIVNKLFYYKLRVDKKEGKEKEIA